MKKLFLSILVVVVSFSPVFSTEKAPKNEKVKNVILIIGDGMGFAATSSWMIDCHYAPTSFDRAQFVGMSKTYSANNRVTDSAAGGTAIACGVKTNNSMLGMTADTVAVPSIAALAKKKGLSTGIVVSSYVLDATPGAFFAHVPKRGMRKEIIDDYLKERPDILVGGGKKYFTDPEYVPENMIDKAKLDGITFVSTPEEFYATRNTPVLDCLPIPAIPWQLKGTPISWQTPRCTPSIYLTTTRRDSSS